MNSLQDLRIFIEIARQGSFSKAAAQVKLTPAALSAALKRLEQQIGTVLIVRSTRHLRLTQSGEVLLAKAEQAIALLEQGLKEVRTNSDELNGHVYLSAPSDFGRNLLLKWISEFTKVHPQVQVKLELSDSVSDMYARHVDLAIRYGEPKDSRLIATALYQHNHKVICASSDYLSKYSPIVEPKQLSQHNCLCFMINDVIEDGWVLRQNDQQVTIRVTGNVSSNDSEAIHRLVLAGHGLFQTSKMDVSEDLLAGRLQMVLSQWQGIERPLYLLCADRRLLNPTIVAFRDFLRQRCQSQHQRMEHL
ncbi:LysR family transcriptional regulator [Celerinatantimonas sp. MCCC 1A17872]|uniref:LysR family transcriptional regulator n=1 Tax=Celerinatantimonas sp. MCCC 1A17872 TaxID=3177514 RepID=UPI0038C9EB29